MNQSSPKRKTREEILELSALLFAQRGYEGVSMRDVAAQVGITPAALYYHFPDKDHLYVESVAQAFREQEEVLMRALGSSGSPWARIEAFITDLARHLAANRGFLRLMQWVQLDSDEARQHKLAESVFKPLFTALHALAKELDPSRDPHLLAISIIGLVIFHFQTGNGHKFMPGYSASHDDPEVLARHVYRLLREAVGSPGEGPG